jgi:hypothetical protein
MLCCGSSMEDALELVDVCDIGTEDVRAGFRLGGRHDEGDCRLSLSTLCEPWVARFLCLTFVFTSTIRRTEAPTHLLHQAKPNGADSQLFAFGKTKRNFAPQANAHPISVVAGSWRERDGPNSASDRNTAAREQRWPCSSSRSRVWEEHEEKTSVPLLFPPYARCPCAPARPARCAVSGC